MDENEVIDTLDGFDGALTALETPAEDSDDGTVVPEVDGNIDTSADESDPAVDTADTHYVYLSGCVTVLLGITNNVVHD